MIIDICSKFLSLQYKNKLKFVGENYTVICITFLEIIFGILEFWKYSRTSVISHEPEEREQNAIEGGEIALYSKRIVNKCYIPKILLNIFLELSV